MSSRVLVVPAIDESTNFGLSSSKNPRYAALITGTCPHEWKGSEPIGPVVRLDADLFRTGDRACVEGTTSRVELLDVEEIPVVTSFLEAPDGRILLLRRSSRVGTFQGRWAGVSGFLEAETPEAQAYTEIREETGLTPEVLHLERAGQTVYARDGARI
ncbi:MAG: NUDIX domain-containing protein, partial [Thermoplasmata archaeon]|nr:NUDIX domain-containing protein [Thermoplasmata archaeon]